jgi:hypothetical protein
MNYSTSKRNHLLIPFIGISKSWGAILAMIFCLTSIGLSQSFAQCTHPSISSYNCIQTHCVNSSFCPNQTTPFQINISYANNGYGVRIYDNAAGTGTPVLSMTGTSTQTHFTGTLPLPSSTSNYYIFILGSTGCQGGYTVLPMTMNTRPSGNPTISGPSQVCYNSSFNLTSSSAPSGQNVNWHLTQNCSDATYGQYGTTYTNSGITTTTTVYAMYVDNASGCRGEAATKTISVYTQLVNCNNVTLSPTTTQTNSNITFGYTGGGTGYSYYWDFGSGANAVNPFLQSGTVSYYTTGTKNISVTITDPNGCEVICYKTVTITAPPCPSSIIISPDSLCTGTTGEFSASDQGSGVNYNWTFSGGSPSSATGIGPHNVSWSTSGSKTVGLTVTKSRCSSNYSSTSVNVGTSFTSPVISGSHTAVQGQAVALSATSVSGATYDWDPDGGVLSGSGNSVDITWANTGTYIVGLNVYNGACVKSDTHIVVVSGATCYTSQSEFGDKVTSSGGNYQMYNAVITDGAGTSATFGMSVIPYTYRLYGPSASSSLLFPRNGDTAICWRHRASTSWANASVTFNTYVKDVQFSIRDLDRNGGSYYDSIYVIAYTSSGTIGLDEMTYTKGSGVGLYGKVFYSITSSVSGTDSSCDVTFNIPDTFPVNKIEIYRRMSHTNSNYIMDLGVSEFTWCTNTPLPVEFGKFDIHLNSDRQVELNWETFSELNNDYFVVERSIDGLQFHAVSDRIRGAGNSNNRIAYDAIDPNPNPGLNYYRVRQVDFNNDTETTETKVVDASQISGAILVYPNPSAGEVTVFNSSMGNRRSTHYQISDILGHLIFEGELEESNNFTIHFPDDISNGTYYLYVENNNSQQQREKIIVIR